MRSINLKEIQVGYQGTPFYKLVKHHLSRQNQEERIQGLQGIIEILPDNAKSLVNQFIDRWNTRAYEKDFWQMDTSSVFNEIIMDARSVFSASRIPFNDNALFNMFNIIVLNYAYNAHDQPKMRKHIGMRSTQIPWISAVSLLYPILAAFYISIRTPASLPMVIGYGLANLGYLMFAAAIFSGTYKIFCITKRWQVFVGAIVAFGVGTILSNVAG